MLIFYDIVSSNLLITLYQNQIRVSTHKGLSVMNNNSLGLLYRLPKRSYLKAVLFEGCALGKSNLSHCINQLFRLLLATLRRLDAGDLTDQLETQKCLNQFQMSLQ